MKANFVPGLSGVALAMMAASLAGAGQARAADKVATAAADNVVLVHCAGVNQCKGHNDCKTANNACKGQGSCKGQGFVGATAEACANIGGKVIDPGKTMTVAASTEVQCVGVNACKGMNDCHTATNACKGQASCKGTGWVSLPSSTCSNIGGKAG